MKISLFSLFFLLACHASAEIDTVRINSLELIGKVHSITEFTYSTIEYDGDILKDELTTDPFQTDKEGRITNFSYSFDEKGNQTQERRYDILGILLSTTNYTYADGLLVESKESVQDSVFGLLNYENKILFKYNENRSLKSKTRYHDGALSYRSNYLYDEKGNRIKEESVDDKGEIQRRRLYHYENNRLVSYKENFSDADGDSYDIIYDSDGEILEKTSVTDDFFIKEKYKYDKKKLPSETCLFNEDGDTTFVSYFAYNEDDTPRCVIMLFPNQVAKMSVVMEFTYSGDLKTIKTSSVFTEDFINKISAKENRIIEYIDKENTYTYEYNFDDHGNWTEQVEYKNTIPILIRTRDITYHE